MAGMTNEQLVEKAVIATDALATQGKLLPAQADKFIDYVIDVTGLKNNARVVRFRNEDLYIDKVGVGKRVAMDATEATAPSVRRGITTSKVQLTPKEVIVPFEISDTFREINLEGEQVEDHIVRMMATQLANDLEQLYIEGDILGRADLEGNLLEGGSGTNYIKDSFLALGDGWLKSAYNGNVVDLAGANISASVFSQLLNAMPAKFKRNRAALRIFSSLDAEQLYRERISSRNTAAGDNALNSTQDLTPYGVPLKPFALYPHRPRYVEHAVLNGTTAVTLKSKNVANVVVTPASLGNTPTAAYAGADLTLDLANGTVARSGASTIATGTTVKITYDAAPVLMMTPNNNMIIGIGRDIRIEKDRDIFKRVNQYAITVKVAVAYEEASAIVVGKNLGLA